MDETNETNETDEVAKRLIAELETDAQLVDRGAFTIDDAMARTKLAHFRLAEPAAWACLVVEAASCFGARRVDVFARLDQLEIRFDGPPLDGDAVFTDAFAEGEPSPRRVGARKLAIASATLFDQLRVAAIEIESPLARVRLLPEGANQREPSGERRNSIRVLGLRPTEEHALLRSRCRYSPLAVSLEHHRVSRGLRQFLVDEGARDITPIVVAERTIGFAGWGVAPAIHLLTHGVYAERVDASNCLAILDVGLRKDLGENSIVRDEQFERSLALVEAMQPAPPPDELGSAGR
ncbi:hypothetical protein ACNOYE_25200 [Nannocystaceae bacterium ST9]